VSQGRQTEIETLTGRCVGVTPPDQGMPRYSPPFDIVNPGKRDDE
jgi:hypothetical protein